MKAKNPCLLAHTALLLLGAVAVLLIGVPASADVLTFDTPGSVVTGPTQAPGVWYTDRYAPAGFQGGQPAPGGKLALQHSISAADAAGSRPPGYTSAFYNTQGRKYDLSSGTISLRTELYIPASWDSLSQGAEGRLAGMWGTAFNATDTVSGYPIIEFSNNVDGGSANAFRVWTQGGTWENVSGFSSFDRWYDLAMDYVNGEFRYFVDGALVYTDSTLTNTTVDLGNVILQGYNAGNNYDIYWGGVTYSNSPVPEPASIAVWSLLGLCGLCYGRRRWNRNG